MLVVSPHVRDSKPVLDSGFYAVDSRFQVLDPDSLQFELGFRIPIRNGIGIPCVIFRISKPRIPDSTRKKHFPDQWNPDSLTWGLVVPFVIVEGCGSSSTRERQNTYRQST